MSSEQNLQFRESLNELLLLYFTVTGMVRVHKYYFHHSKISSFKYLLQAVLKVSDEIFKLIFTGEIVKISFYIESCSDSATIIHDVL